MRQPALPNEPVVTATATLRLAGEPSLQCPAAQPVALNQRDAALLAWLAIEGPTPRARLAALFWPDSDQDGARNALRQRIFQLRKLAGVNIVVGTTTLELDQGVVHDLLDADGVLGTRRDEIGGEFGQWLTRQRERRHARMRQALVELSDMAEQARDWADALLHARDALDIDPLSEAAHRRVMRLHYLAGDRAAALLAFDACERMLKDEVGARPSAETLALLATVERSSELVATPRHGRVPAAVLRPPRLIGRDAECAQMAGAIAERAVVVLAGEAGMGKTRLLAESAATHGADALVVGARPGDGGVPHALTARLLRTLLQHGCEPDAAQRADLSPLLPDDAGSTPAPGERPARLVAALRGLIEQAASRGLAAVFVDDLQFADAASVEVLQALVDDTPCAWALAHRPAELQGAARRLVDRLADNPATPMLTLAPLDVPAIAALLESLAIDGIGGQAQAEGLQRRTGGNPLYLLETLKALLSAPGEAAAAGGAVVWPRAENVQRLIQQRLARLSPAAQRLARCAAVAGQDLDAQLAGRMLGQRPLDLVDAWAELEAAQVLRNSAFAHDLIAEAALAAIPAAIARTLHGDAAAALEETGAEAARIATHWLAAGADLKAAPHLHRAAVRAFRAWQRDEAAGLGEQAATILRAAGETRAAFAALVTAAEAASDVSYDARLVRIVTGLEELAQDDGQHALAAWMRAVVLIEVEHRHDDARQVLQSALPRAERAALPDVEAELLWTLAVLHFESREITQATRCCEQALAALDRLVPGARCINAPNTHYKATQALGWLHGMAGRLADSLKYLLEAQRMVTADPAIGPATGSTALIARTMLDQGDLAGARHWCGVGMAAARAAPIDAGAEAMVLRQHLQVSALAGELGAALGSAERGEALCRQKNFRYGVKLLRDCAWLYQELGRRDLAVQQLRELRSRDDLTPIDRVLVEATWLQADGDGDSDALLEHAMAIDDLSLRVRVLCHAQPRCDVQRILPLLALSVSNARDCEAHGLWLSLQVRRVAALRMAARPDEAADLARALWPRIEQGLVGIEPYPRMAVELHRALVGPQQDLARQIALGAAAWMQRAAATLPPEWRQNYLMRAPGRLALAG